MRTLKLHILSIGYLMIVVNFFFFKHFKQSIFFQSVVVLEERDPQAGKRGLPLTVNHFCSQWSK